MVEESSDYWLDRCFAAAVPAAPLSFPVEMLFHPLVLENEVVSERTHDITGPQRGVRPPFKFTDCPLEDVAASPPLGRDTDMILHEIGYSDEDIQALRDKDGVIG